MSTMYHAFQRPNKEIIVLRYSLKVENQTKANLKEDNLQRHLSTLEEVQEPN